MEKRSSNSHRKYVDFETDIKYKGRGDEYEIAIVDKQYTEEATINAKWRR